ncbi:hypothetical protein [Nostoc sp. LPT]|uniref:hypothetical protein n=1 Tax=Nostoc sp. LPT TaxID=2815387 RepID=UPI001DB74706|nr:hypothetical protein [Nostoc sp. LPT]MBN4000983.1 hypothetical protein [Nostoc sp. LPT]
MPVRNEDLAGFAKAVLKVVDSNDLPLRLTIGNGGAKLVYQKIEGKLKKRDKWKSV